MFPRPIGSVAGVERLGDDRTDSKDLTLALALALAIRAAILVSVTGRLDVNVELGPRVIFVYHNDSSVLCRADTRTRGVNIRLSWGAEPVHIIDLAVSLEYEAGMWLTAYASITVTAEQP